MTECWHWGGGYSHGYGRLWDGGRYRPAHRVVYEGLVGPIPEGLEIDHLCRVPSCVNPAHLEPVTHRENMLRGDTFAARRAAATECIHGHTFDADNTYIKPNGCRLCLTCHHERRLQRYHARKS